MDDGNARLSAALGYVRRSWPVIPLHDVSMGFCSCGDTSEKHQSTVAGKHPIARAWQHSGVMDEEILGGIFGGRPGLNIGIQTGIRSGIWALDVDPKHGGDLRLAELEKEHGTLPDTYSQRTGSGGRHYVFTLPADFTPSNSKGTLPPGLDVRGEGGFIVGAPSVSGVGPYEVLLNIPVASAPDWLLEMIRPRVPRDTEHAEALAHWHAPGLEGLGDRGQRYAAAVVSAECAKLAGAVPGERGFTAYRVACNLVELVNSPWAELSPEAAKGAFITAAQHAQRMGGAFDDREAWTSWISAERRIGARGRAAPSAGGGTLISWEQIGAQPGSGVPPFGLDPGQGIEGDSFPTSMPVTFPPVPPAPSFGIFAAQENVDLFPPIFPPPSSAPAGTAVPHDPVEALLSKFLTGTQLAELPPPRWLIDQWITRDSAVQIIGKPEEGKSFVALDMSMHIALGRMWHGRAVQQGRVGYIVAEGLSGMGQRYLAWCLKHNEGKPVEGIHFLPHPVQAADRAGWDILAIACERLKLDFIVLDTQARMTVGLDENSAKEMGLFVEQLEYLRRVTGATVATVHHKGKQGETARGSSALLGAVTTEITVSRAEDIVTVAITKQKDAERAAPCMLQLVSVQTGKRPGGTVGGWAGLPDEVITAGVLVSADASQVGEWAQLKGKEIVLKVLRDFFPNRGATKAEAGAMATQKAGQSKSAFYRAWDSLEESKLISRVIVDDRETGKWVVTPVDQRTSHIVG